MKTALISKNEIDYLEWVKIVQMPYTKLKYFLY